MIFFSSQWLIISDLLHLQNPANNELWALGTARSKQNLETVFSSSENREPESRAGSTCDPQTQRRRPPQRVESTGRRQSSLRETNLRSSWSSSRSRREPACSASSFSGGFAAVSPALQVMVRWESRHPPPGDCLHYFKVFMTHLHIVWRGGVRRLRLKWIWIPRSSLLRQLKLGFQSVGVPRGVSWRQFRWACTKLGGQIWQEIFQSWDR